MERYGSLLKQVARQYKIYQGKRESDRHYKIRLIYSICALMAYTALLDDPVNEQQTNSTQHVKKRIRAILDSYLFMYPELKDAFANAKKVTLEDHLTDLLFDSGMAYHRPHRIQLSMHREVTYQGIRFERGIAPDAIDHVSGMGLFAKPYTTLADAQMAEQRAALRQMFNIDTVTLDKTLAQVIQDAQWTKASLDPNELEYLNPDLTQKHSYWVSNPVKSDGVWFAVRRQDFSKEYYLYNYKKNELYVSRIEQWMVDDGYCRTIACALLMSIGKLPPITFTSDGDIVHLTLGYLLPKHELALLMLYSWPTDMNNLDSVFSRTIDHDVFFVIRDFLFHQGYSFKEIINHSHKTRRSSS